MTKTKTCALIMFMIISCQLMAQSTNIVGLWKIEKLDFTFHDKEMSTQPRAYFADLLDHKIGLVFDGSGLVYYENSGNENEVHYTIQKGNLLLYTRSTADSKSKSANTETFGLSIFENKMQLTMRFSNHIETYTLIKQ